MDRLIRKNSETMPGPHDAEGTKQQMKDDNLRTDERDRQKARKMKALKESAAKGVEVTKARAIAQSIMPHVVAPTPESNTIAKPVTEGDEKRKER